MLNLVQLINSYAYIHRHTQVQTISNNLISSDFSSLNIDSESPLGEEDTLEFCPPFLVFTRGKI